MKTEILNVNDKFQDVGISVIDNHKRISIANLIGNQIKTVRLYMNTQGEILLQPLVAIPPDEQWLFKNEEAFESVQNGLRDAAEGKISKLELDELEDD